MQSVVAGLTVVYHMLNSLACNMSWHFYTIPNIPGVHLNELNILLVS